MAKKQQPKLSYGPNMGLIAGEAAVAQSEATLGNAVGAFAQGFQTVFGALQKEEEERAAKMEAYVAEFPGLEQMNFMANATNKQVVTDFLNKQRDEYNRLSAIHEKTKDRKVMDQMNAIKFSIANLDDQIKVFNQDKQEYRTAFDENQLADGQVFDKDFYTNIFTNNAKFNITENGDIAFDISGKKNKSNLYKDHAGNWTNRNNISESSFLEMYAKAQASGEKGNAFYRDTTYRALLSNLKATGNEGLQTFVTTDLTGDNSDFTFQQQWANGMLDAKFYTGRKKEDGTDWMFDNKNAGELRKLAADYYTDVVEDGYNTGKKNYVDPDDINNDKNKYFKLNQNFGGGVTGGVLNKLIDDLDSGTINIDGKEYNVNPNNNSWSSQDGDIKSGNDVLQHYYDAYGSDFAFYNDIRFSEYRGTKTKEEELVTSTTIEDVENNVKKFFVDLGMLDAEGNYIPFEASGLDKILGGGDLRMGKNRVDLKEKINSFLKQAGVEGTVATSSITSPNSIELNGKQYTFKQGAFENNYRNLIEDLSDILKAGEVGQIKDFG